MDVGMIVQWRLVVSAKEFRLIQRALRGQLDENEKLEALELQEKMMRTRAAEAAQLHNEAMKVVANMDAAKETDKPL